MVYREHGMWEVLEVLRRLWRGESQVRIAAATGLSRKTVRHYLRRAVALGWKPGGQEPDEVLAVRVLEHGRPGPKDPGPGGSEGILLAHREQIRQWLSPSGSTRGLKLTKVHRLLERRGIAVPYSSLHRFAVKHCQFGKGRITVRCAPCKPGELSEVDFGRLGYIVDPQTHRRQLLWALVVVLVFSRHMYVHITRRQKLPDVIDGLEAAWEFFGGVSTRAILDNLKAAIVKADRYDPIFQRTFGEYAKHRGFVIDPAAAYHPTGKPFVERQVPYVRDGFFRGEEFIDAEHVQREATRWCLEVAGTRVHGTTRRRPLAVFEEEEKSVLRPLGGERFDTPHWAECRVHPDHHVQFHKALYSVPTKYHRKKVTVRGDRYLVRIFFRGQLIKTHTPQPPGGRSTDYNDYPKELGAYARRDPDYMIGEAKKLGTDIGGFTEKLLSGDFPWAKLRQAQKLIRLAKKYGARRLEEACGRALAFDVINVKRVENILLRALREPPAQSPGQITLLPARFLRPEGSFTHPSQTQKEETTDGDQGVTESRAQETETLGDAGHVPGSGGLRQEGQTDLRGLPGTDPPG
jgi:transposase